jgi:hypothetical protein
MRANFSPRSKDPAYRVTEPGQTFAVSSLKTLVSKSADLRLVSESRRSRTFSRSFLAAW